MTIGPTSLVAGNSTSVAASGGGVYLETTASMGGGGSTNPVFISGFDSNTSANFYGPYDLGVDETTFNDTPLVADGFESGNTSAWSSSSP